MPLARRLLPGESDVPMFSQSKTTRELRYIRVVSGVLDRSSGLQSRPVRKNHGSPWVFRTTEHTPGRPEDSGVSRLSTPALPWVSPTLIRPDTGNSIPADRTFDVDEIRN